MATKIRLKRLGKIRSPHYRIIVIDSRAKRDGQAIEEIGLYHPKNDPSVIRVDSERAQYWLGVGAQPCARPPAGGADGELGSPDRGKLLDLLADAAVRDHGAGVGARVHGDPGLDGLPDGLAATLVQIGHVGEVGGELLPGRRRVLREARQVDHRRHQRRAALRHLGDHVV